jgi:hypothetical protein
MDNVKSPPAGRGELMRSVIFNRYQLRGSEDNLSLIPHRLGSGKMTIRLHDVNLVIVHRDLLVIKHDGGEACLTNPHPPRNRPLLQALYAIHGIHIVESDEYRYLNRRLAGIPGVVFIVAIAAIVAAAIYITVPPEGNQTGAGVYATYLLPGFCLAFLAREAIQRIMP